jgi:hypothetical protein
MNLTLIQNQEPTCITSHMQCDAFKMSTCSKQCMKIKILSNITELSNVLYRYKKA